MELDEYEVSFTVGQDATDFAEAACRALIQVRADGAFVNVRNVRTGETRKLNICADGSVEEA
jgi:hypothetical protein